MLMLMLTASAEIWAAASALLCSGYLGDGGEVVGTELLTGIEELGHEGHEGFINRAV